MEHIIFYTYCHPDNGRANGPVWGIYARNDISDVKELVIIYLMKLKVLWKCP